MKILTFKQVHAIFTDYYRSNFDTQQECADHYGVTRQYVSSILGGHDTPSARMLADVKIVKKSVFMLEK
jgi:predicted DNA-binding protein YlxM (UPF0122 family)